VPTDALRATPWHAAPPRWPRIRHPATALMLLALPRRDRWPSTRRPRR